MRELNRAPKLNAAQILTQVLHRQAEAANWAVRMPCILGAVVSGHLLPTTSSTEQLENGCLVLLASGKYGDGARRRGFAFWRRYGGPHS